jgi:hypothetical protein
LQPDEARHSFTAALDAMPGDGPSMTFIRILATSSFRFCCSQRYCTELIPHAFGAVRFGGFIQW